MVKTKRCPYCGEEIMAAAKKCRYCNEWLSKDGGSGGSATQREAAKTDDDSGNSDAGALALIGGCGLLFWAGIIFGIVMLLHFTVPSSSRMEDCIREDVADVTASNASDVATFLGGDDLGFLADVLMDTDVMSGEVMSAFDRYNTIEIDESFCWSVGYIRNYTTSGEGRVGCFGILGIVIPLVEWDDFVLTASD